MTADVRAYVAGLLDAWQSGARRPPDVFADARSSWLFGGWPKSFERGYDAIGMEVLYVLATARDMGLDHDDIPALREYLSATDQVKARELFDAHWEAPGRNAREAAGLREDYYGPPPSDGVEDLEFALTDPEDRQLHHLVRTDPESAWADLRARLCEPAPRDELFLLDLVEDLMFNDPDSFIDRLETLVAECPEAREPVAFAHIGGRASSPGLERFWALQERLGGQET